MIPLLIPQIASSSFQQKLPSLDDLLHAFLTVAHGVSREEAIGILDQCGWDVNLAYKTFIDKGRPQKKSRVTVATPQMTPPSQEKLPSLEELLHAFLTVAHGVSREEAFGILDQCGWDVDLALSRFIDKGRPKKKPKVTVATPQMTPSSQEKEKLKGKAVVDQNDTDETNSSSSL